MDKDKKWDRKEVVTVDPGSLLDVKGGKSIMEVSLAVLADYSNVSKEGKLNILGIFDIIRARNFPAIHPNMQLVITFEAPRTELKEDKNEN